MNSLMLLLSLMLAISITANVILLFEKVGLQQENEEHLREIELRYNELLMKYFHATNRNTILESNKTTVKINEDIIEAVKYAMNKAHPDNGGLNDDFIKFHKLYQRICK